MIPFIYARLVVNYPSGGGKWFIFLRLSSIKFRPPTNHPVSTAWFPTVDVKRGRVTRNSRQKKIADINFLVGRPIHHD